jgi:DNA polymerase-3 subunit alpha
MTTRAVLKDVGKVIGLNFDYMNDLTKNVPHKCDSIESAIEDNKVIAAASKGTDDEVKKWNKELKSCDDPLKAEQLKSSVVDRKKKLIKTFEVAKKLEGIYRQRSTHACALLIADENVFGKIPLCYDTTNKKLLTAYDMYELERLGYLKLDILGLKTLSVVEKVMPGIIDRFDNPMSENPLQFDDQNVFKLIATGNTKGVFQLDEQLGQTWCKKLKPKNIQELSDVIAISRTANRNGKEVCRI